VTRNKAASSFKDGDTCDLPARNRAEDDPNAVPVGSGSWGAGKEPTSAYVETLPVGLMRSE
jgi:hypothetical protein